MSCHRDRRKLSAEILEVISQGEKKPNNIMRKVGTNYKVGREILMSLTDYSLVSCTEIGDRFREYSITEKGSKFLRHFKDMEAMMNCL